MSDENNTHRLAEGEESLGGDALLHAVRRDMLALFELVSGLDHKVSGLDQKVSGLDQKVIALDQKVIALDQKVDARLHDTRPMWEGVVSRLDTIEIEQRREGASLDAIAAEQKNQSSRLDAIETEQKNQSSRLDAIEARLDAIEVKLKGFDTIEPELRHLRRRIERMVGQLSQDVIEVRAAQHDLEDQVEKLENAPA